jgi:hypothetical protein
MPTFDMTKSAILLKKINLLKPVDSFLLDTFFPFSPLNISATDEVYFDTVKGGRKIAPTVTEYGKVKEFIRDPYTTDKIVPALIGFKRSITPQTVSKRIAGEPVFNGGLTPDERAAYLQIQDIQDIIDSIIRRQEYLVRQLFLTGKVTSIANYDGDTSLNIDYGVSADCILTLSGTDMWSNASSDPISQMVATRRKISERSGLAPAVALCGVKAWQSFRNNANVTNKFWYNSPNYNFGKLDPQIQSRNITYLGRVNEANLDLYLYDGWTIDPISGISQQIIPDNAVLFLPDLQDAPKAFSMRYGAVTYLADDGNNFITYANRYVPREYADVPNSVKGLEIVSRCLPVLNIVDSFQLTYVC